jgi:hypothetical protein
MCASGFASPPLEEPANRSKPWPSGRRIRLITPCPSSDRWSDGYWIFEEGHFQTAADLDALLEGMMDRHMKTAIGADNLVRFRRDLVLKRPAMGIVSTLSGPRALLPGIRASAENGRNSARRSPKAAPPQPKSRCALRRSSIVLWKTLSTFSITFSRAVISMKNQGGCRRRIARKGDVGCFAYG